MSYISSLEGYQVDALRQYLLGNFEAFSKFIFKIMTGTVMLNVDYYVVLFAAIQRLIDQESTRMIMNIPPRAGKTLLVSISLPLYGWCRNPCGQTIITGFNGDVLSECTGYIRSIMVDPDFKVVFPDVVLDINKKSVERLGTVSAGVIHAIPTTGKLTGKGAGALVPEFSGLLCIDDVIKPDDAHSPTERNKVNSRFTNTILSRLNSEETPLAIIMQRLHADDLCGYLMKGGTSDIYDWLNIPGVITKETGSKEWYDDQIREMGYSNVHPITYDLKRPDEMFDENGESSFWDIRKNMETLKGLRNKDPYTFYSQYMGIPRAKGTAALTMELLRFYDAYDLCDLSYTFMTADTAATTKTYSDYSVFCFWGFSRLKELILIDVHLGKWEIPDLIEEARAFWNKHARFNMNLPNLYPRGMHMEDKSSGLFLNQQFLRDGTVLVKPVPRDGNASNDKFSRFMNTIPYFQKGKVVLPKNHEHTQYCIRELLGQSEYGSATGHDDFADNVSDACNVVFDTHVLNYEDWN